MLALALLLDAALGEPAWLWRRLPHPVVLLGRLLSRLEAALNRGPARRAKGVAALALLLAAAGLPAWGLAALPAPLGPALEVLGAAILIAQRSLVEHVAAVAGGLARGLDEGRRAVSMIVGRDPEALDRPGVARAAIESAAENFSDGVAAPVFWFAVAGLPGIALYKAVNTADSMIGHRTSRHEAFGWAAARLDDLANLVPARLSGLLLALVSGRPGAALACIRAEAHRHRSPNAGWPEAAMAAGLGVALSGPRAYQGRMSDEPWVNAGGLRDPGPAEIRAACRLLWRAWAVLLGLAGLALLGDGL
ncbi:adenosylcobinamide-phosphate synthase CbiB [Paralimibaculum aggregatum]|uniref:Cobalamin biosynthesis protein CobD n=1 Tax=Paralimibaculum aggregatum TaxID=3036245 RepID=A0ABQ6LM10_9RHOB|nr:adenosylcobinamide-phosphate synthase CbiB [Limibaculum sp. NKW23]GMG84242.1 adenosylcobinamide-phosphate synthase CbiB [Limibaculum sp. NKW23]